MASPTLSAVRMVVYDISGGLARQLGASMLGMQLDCLPHTGIIVFGKEYFYGGGVQRLPHEQVVRQFGISPMREEVLGRTEKTVEDLHRFLETISSRFRADTYDLFRNNCNHFSDEVVRFLLNGVGIPSEIVNLPERVMSTPMGQMLAPLWSNMQQRMQNDFVPFNTAPPATPSFTAPNNFNPVARTSAIPSTSSKTTLVDSLKGLTESTSPKETVVALETLAKILKNIIANPMEEKYRRLSLQNERFQNAIGRFKDGFGCLTCLGFEVDATGKLIVMVPDPAKWEKLQISQKIINVARKKAILNYISKEKLSTPEQAYEVMDKSDVLVQEAVASAFSAKTTIA